ncbi:MAG: transcriptional repressor [Desulfamplus sp.]|nr:transcriptional repressor [Desulfamplus sp.]
MVDYQERFDIIIKKLKDNGHKITPQRIGVIKIMAGSEGHPSVEKVYEQLQNEFPTMSLATVYRTVLLIKSLGEALELGFPDGSNRYDANKPYPHPHVICVKCGKIIDPDISSLQDMQQEIADETGFKILTHRLDFFGICSDCPS